MSKFLVILHKSKHIDFCQNVHGKIYYYANYSTLNLIKFYKTDLLLNIILFIYIFTITVFNKVYYCFIVLLYYEDLIGKIFRHVKN